MSVVSYLRNTEKSRPGQQLLPDGVVNFLKTINIMFGTTDEHDKIDYDPTVALVNHIVECVGALRDVNRVYVGKGSVAAKSIGTRALFGLMSEMSSLMLDICTWTPTQFTPPDMIKCYSRVAFTILSVMPEFGEVEPLHPDDPVRCGRLLLHHAIGKVSEGAVPVNFIEMLIRSNPKSLMHRDNEGYIPLHLALQDSVCPLDVLELLLGGDTPETNSLAIPDKYGFLPLHLAVRHANCTPEVVARMLQMYPKAAWTACQVGSIPLHWAVGKPGAAPDRHGESLPSPNMAIVQQVFNAFPDGGRTCCDNGWLPLHWCVNRSNVDMDVLSFLVDVYPVAVQLPVSDTGQLPLHLLLAQDNPSLDAADMLINAYPRSAQVCDDDGYLPLHTALDSAGQDLDLVQLLLEVYPLSVREPTANGWLPLHVALSSDGANETVIQRLLNLYPEAAVATATDLVALNGLTPLQQRHYRDASIDNPGAIIVIDEVEYVERKWSPLSKAIERGLAIVVKIIRKVIDGGSAANDLSFLSVAEPQPSVSRGNSPEHQMSRQLQHDSHVVYDRDSQDGGSSSERNRDVHQDRREWRDQEYRRFKSAGQTRKKGSKSKGRSSAPRHRNSRDRDNYVHQRERETSAPPIRNVEAERGPGFKPSVNFASSENVELLQHQMNRMQVRQEQINASRMVPGGQMDSYILRSSTPNAPLTAGSFSALDPHNQSSRLYSRSIDGVGGVGQPPPILAHIHHQHANIGRVINDIYAGVGAPPPQTFIGDGLTTASVGSLSSGTAESARPGVRPPAGPSAPLPVTKSSVVLRHEESDENSHMRVYVDQTLDLGPDVTIVSDNEDTPRSWAQRGKPIPGDDHHDDFRS